MKRILLVGFTVLCMSLSADYVKVADLVAAKQTDLINAANRLGSFTGNPTLGMMLAMGLGGVGQEFGLGAMRQDKPLMLAFYIDELAHKNGVFNDNTARAVFFYPTSLTKKEYLKSNPGAKDVDGVVKNNGLTMSFTPKSNYVCIVPGGSADFVKKAASGVDNFAPLEKSQVVRINITESGNKVVSQFAAKSTGKGSKINEKAINIIKALKDVTISIAVGEYGVDINVSYTGSSNSWWDSFGKKTISSSEPLAFAGNDSILACAYAPESKAGDWPKLWGDLMSLIAKWGFKTNWQKIETKGTCTKITLDYFAFVDYMNKEGDSVISKLDKDGKLAVLSAEVMKLFESDCKLSPAEQSVAFYLKGCKSPASAQKRFNDTLPEFSKKPCVMVGVTSLYGIIKSVGGMLLSTSEDKNLATMKAMFAALPPATDAAIAMVWTRTALRHNVTIRLNPSEIKGLYTYATGLMMPAAFGGREEIDESVESLDDED